MYNRIIIVLSSNGKTLDSLIVQTLSASQSVDCSLPQTGCRMFWALGLAFGLAALVYMSLGYGPVPATYAIVLVGCSRRCCQCGIGIFELINKILALSAFH